MAVQKKHGKGRLDKWYKLAKEKGYRARAAFKLIQLNKKYGFLEKSKVLIDLCAAPGSWCQVAAEVMPVNSLIIGVDLAHITPIPRCITFQSDITTDKCRATIRQHLKTWKADTVLHDGAPNVGTAWVQDAYSQAELVLQSLRLATDFLREGGTFVTKVFRSKDYNPLLWVFNQLFSKVEATKPPSSRTVSAEIFVVCRGYKAPKRIDPKFLDPRSVFAELADPTPNNEAKVFNPEKKKRKREGYEEGDWTQFKEASAAEFVETADPIAMLGSYNRIHFEQRGNGDIALATLNKLPETTEEIRECCKDLKVLGRKEFRILLRWRLKARDIFGISTKKKLEQEKAAEAEEVAEVESMDEEMQLQEDLRRLKEKDDKGKRRERRKENEKKQKDIVRMQLNMTTPVDIGMEQAGPNGEESMFQLKAIEKAGNIEKVAKGTMAIIEEKKTEEADIDEEVESDEEEDELERQLDDMYEDYTERKAAADAKYRAKRARKEHEDGEWGGLSDEDGNAESSDDELVLDEESETSDDEEVSGTTLTTTLQQERQSANGLSRRAAMFFQQDIFKDIEGLSDEVEDDSDSGIALEDDDDDDGVSERSEPSKLSPSKSDHKQRLKKKPNAEKNDDGDDDMPDDNGGFEVVKAKRDDPWTDNPEPLVNGRPDVDIITAEAMTLAQQMATGKKTKHDLIDDGFNKYSLRDSEGLPEWFVDDEAAHSRPLRPITAAGAAAIKEKLRALNARPIKKVREAKARKKFKAAQKLEKLKKKSALLADDEAMSEKDKAGAIAKLMARAAKKKPKKQVKVVVAKGGNRGIQGRPRGTKGKYKMVDSRLKKDVRAEKRLKKKMK